MAQLELKIQTTHTDYLRDPNPCLQLYGVTEGERCRACAHLLVFQRSRRKRWYKCRFRKITHGPATDHSPRWQACGRFEGVSYG